MASGDRITDLPWWFPTTHEQMVGIRTPIHNYGWRTGHTYGGGRSAATLLRGVRARESESARVPFLTESVTIMMTLTSQARPHWHWQLCFGLTRSSCRRLT